MTNNPEEAGASGLARLWHEDITGMVAGARLYPEQTEYVLVADYDRIAVQRNALLAALSKAEQALQDAMDGKVVHAGIVLTEIRAIFSKAF